MRTVKTISILLGAALIIGCSAPTKANKTQKTFVVLGDSYSTMEGSMPEGYKTWYVHTKVNEKRGNDVFVADSTWWGRLEAQSGYRMLINSSYSGSTICTTGYHGNDYSDRCFVTRTKADIVTPEGKPGRAGEFPDVVLIFGGTNDCWAKSPVGEMLPKDKWESADLSQWLPASSYLLGYLRRYLPKKTRIIVICNDMLGDTYEQGFKALCDEYNAEYFLLHDIAKEYRHPTNVGMKQICDQLLPLLK